MPTKIKVEHSPDEDLAFKIRSLVCNLVEHGKKGSNPLTETNFNELLDRITQEAFDSGRAFERKYPDLRA